MNREFGTNINLLLEKRNQENPMPIKERLKLIEDIVRPKQHRSGTVVHISVDEDNPTEAVVFFDGGRRMKTDEYDEGIILEGVHVKTAQLFQDNIQLDDFVEAGYFFDTLKRVVSTVELDKIDVRKSDTNFDWDSVVGAIIWDK